MEKVFCPRCKAFIGFAREDGSGPYLDDCASTVKIRGTCPMVSQLAANVPRRAKGYDIGTNSGPMDYDSGGYGPIAIRELEDSPD